MHIDLVHVGQHESLVDLMHEMCVFYSDEAPVARDDVRSNLLQNLLAPASPVRIAVATDDAGRAIGLAAVARLHSLVDPAPQRRGQLLLKELYVRDSHRGQGVGKALMAWVARHAQEQGCARIDWHVSASNRPGLAFYRSLGALHVAGRLSFRLGGDTLARLADGDADRGPLNIPASSAGTGSR